MGQKGLPKTREFFVILPKFSKTLKKTTHFPGKENSVISESTADFRGGKIETTPLDRTRCGDKIILELISGTINFGKEEEAQD